MENGLSILIPTYNYDTYHLVNSLAEEAASLDFTYEIIVLDDASTITFPNHSQFSKFEHTAFIPLEKNVGRTAARDLLAEKASYTYLLFLDADVLPVASNFLKNYIHHIQPNTVLFGGITYKEERPKEDEILRWVYGHSREKQTVSQRKESPYQSFTTGCFLIERALFLTISKTIQLKAYGMDLLLKQKLEEQQVPIVHIENPVYHLGLESNEQFLKKALEAVATTVTLEAKGLLPKDARKLQKTYLKLKKWGALAIFQLYFSTITSKVVRNLHSEQPNMRWFDLYRLNYYIQLKQQERA